jgi:hypothetical protein
MLTLRIIGIRDYSIHDDGKPHGRIRFASERNPGIWTWHVQIHLPGPPYGSVASIAAVDGERPQPLGGWAASEPGPPRRRTGLRATDKSTLDV